MRLRSKLELRFGAEVYCEWDCEMGLQPHFAQWRRIPHAEQALNQVRNPLSTLTVFVMSAIPHIVQCEQGCLTKCFRGHRVMLSVESAQQHKSVCSGRLVVGLRCWPRQDIDTTTPLPSVPLRSLRPWKNPIRSNPIANRLHLSWRGSGPSESLRPSKVSSSGLHYSLIPMHCSFIQTSLQLCLTPHMLTTQRYNPPRGSIVSSSHGIGRLHNLHAKHSEAPASRRVLIESLRKTEKVGLRLGRVCAHHGPRIALPLAGACCSSIRPHASKFDSTSPVII